MKHDAELRKLELTHNSMQTNAYDSVTQSTHFEKEPLPRLRDNEDIDVFLQPSELLAESNQWDKNKWANHLVPALLGTAKEAFANLQPL